MGGLVLFIEDDVAIRRVVQPAFSADGLTLIEAPTAHAGLEALARHDVDVVLLDLMLPDCDGFEVCREIRRRSDVPVIMVTARDRSQDVVTGLESGADDYVTKPFVPKELAARARAHLRRSRGTAGEDALVLGDLEIAPRKGVVTRGGKVLNLTRTEFELLCRLASDPGRVFTREELLNRVWGHGYFADIRLVDVHIRRLRLKVEDDPAEPSVVQTVRGMGYRLNT